MRGYLSLPVALIFSGLALSSVCGAEEAAPPRTIATSGEAVVYVVPDEAVVTLGIETFATDLEKARAANEAASTTLLAAVKGLNVEPKHVQTDAVRVEIRYHEHAIEGYYARRTYSVTLKDVKLLGKLIDAALKNGANQLTGVEFRTTEPRKHRDQARKMAVVAAREKAQALAAELGCRVGAPRTITEGGGYFGYSNNWNANGFQNAAQAPAGGDAEGDVNPLGQIGVRATISVVFDLVPEK